MTNNLPKAEQLWAKSATDHHSASSFICCHGPRSLFPYILQINLDMLVKKNWKHTWSC